MIRLRGRLCRPRENFLKNLDLPLDIGGVF